MPINLSYSGFISLTLPFFKLGSLKESLFFNIVANEDFEFSIVLELIFSREKDGFDLILSGVLKLLSCVGRDLVSTEERRPEA